MENENLAKGKLNINNINFDNLINVDLFETRKIYDEKKFLIYLQM
jgi:hypothetical protein